MDAAPPPGGGGHDDRGTGPRKTGGAGVPPLLDAFGDNEMPILATLFVFAMLVEYFRSISPCTC